MNMPHQEIIWLMAFLVSVDHLCLMCKAIESDKLSTNSASSYLVR